MTKWFTTSTPSMKHMEINNIVFRQENTQIVLNVQDDVTAKESTLISVMFCVAVGSAMTFALWDYIGYIKEHGLERHFQFKEEEKK